MIKYIDKKYIHLIKTHDCSFLLQMNVGEESAVKEESLKTVVLQVHSSSIAAVCGLHHAVLCRIQV